ncbi:MAG: hypothetical protein DMF80_17925 [Acidobacteria bacterium]|nr:MAG: hypothetical protein DMF80_17925 [Acidobacteriota bacterium]
MRPPIYHTLAHPAGPSASLDLLRARPAEPASTVRPAASSSEEEASGRVLACAGCRLPVTTSAARMEVAGSHEHTFANPAGFSFRIGCFSDATGCVAVGEPSAYWSWFPPHSWLVEQCAACRQHLGWLFRAGTAGFHGLILDRLLEVDEEG